MNQIQAKRVEQIKKMVLTHRLNQEIKEFKVEETDDGIVYVWCITGRPKDEGTLAELYARQIYHFFIGKRGRLNSIYSDHTKAYNKVLASMVRSVYV